MSPPTCTHKHSFRDNSGVRSSATRTSAAPLLSETKRIEPSLSAASIRLTISAKLSSPTKRAKERNSVELTIERLIEGDDEIANLYWLARVRWEGILRAVGQPIDVLELAARLRVEQHWFEENCGGMYIGQEIMAVVGVTHLYSVRDGFAENLPTARAVADVFQASLCSVAVKDEANKIAALYGVIES